MTDFKQLASEEAAAQSFSTLLDLIPDSEPNQPCIFSTDGRQPLMRQQLKEFMRQGAACGNFVRFRPRDGQQFPQHPRVVLALPNGPEAAVAFLTLSVRCTVAPLNIATSEGEARFELVNLPADVVITQQGHDNAIATVAKELGIPHVELVPDVHTAGLYTLQHAVPVSDACDEMPLVSRNDVCLLLHTSGTTLKPKLVPLTQENLCVAALCIRSTLQLDSSDICLNLMPLHHLHGIMVNLLVSIISGGAVVCTPGWKDAVQFFDHARTFKCTWYSAVPSMHNPVMQHAEKVWMRTGVRPEHCLRFARNCSAALLPTIARRMETALQCVVLPTYAMSECVPICSNPMPWHPRLHASVNKDPSESDTVSKIKLDTVSKIKLDSVGRPAGPDVSILDAHGKLHVVEPNSPSSGIEGEVCVRGRCCTSGYEFRDHMDRAFQAHVDGGWLRTGDKGHFDADGYVYLTGRFKELINRGGEKLSPLLIEDIVCGLVTEVKECTVFACPHEELGEAVAVAMVLKEEFSPEEFRLAKLRTLMLQSKKISHIWVPECLVFIDELPKGPTGKPMRIGLAKRFGLKPLTHHTAAGAAAVSTGAVFRAKRDASQEDKWILEPLSQGQEVDVAVAHGETDDPVLRHVRAAVVQVLCVEDGSVPDDGVLVDYGLDSMRSVVLVDRLCDTFEIELQTNALDVYPSCAHLARHIRAIAPPQHTPQPFRDVCEYEATADVFGTDGGDDSSNGVGNNVGTNDGNGTADPASPHASTTSDKAKSRAAQRNRAKMKAERKSQFNGKKPGKNMVENANNTQSGLYAAKMGDVDAVRKKMLEKTPSGDPMWDPKTAVDRHGLTALQWAAGQGHLDVTRLLVEEAHCDVHQTNKEGRTALMWACRNGHLDLAKYLVAHGADIHAVTKKGVSCLHWATWGGSIEVTAWLLDQGMDLEALSNAGCNAAVWAAAAGRVAMCEYLKKRGADFQRVNHWGHGVVSKASWHGHIDVLRWLFDNAGVIHHMFLLNHIGEIPVELAEQAGKTETVQFMLKTMKDNLQIFVPFQGAPDVHQHKQVKLSSKQMMEDM
eukprot:m.779038 g.779038  ORF g.779038 m.779038 type:complete len:1064 (+) comp23276_c1_seq6:299-3490(+)